MLLQIDPIWERLSLKQRKKLKMGRGRVLSRIGHSPSNIKKTALALNTQKGCVKSKNCGHSCGHMFLSYTTTITIKITAFDLRKFHNRLHHQDFPI